MLVVWTQNSVESRWVRGEARDGADRGILVPVRFGNAPLPIDFRAIRTIDLGDTPDPTQSPKFQEVIQALGTVIARRGAPQSNSATLEAPVAASVSPTGPPRVAICVLPLSNLSADPDQQVFSDGITQDIITELSRWRLLAVQVAFGFLKVPERSLGRGSVGRAS